MKRQCCLAWPEEHLDWLVVGHRQGMSGSAFTCVLRLATAGIPGDFSDHLAEQLELLFQPGLQGRISTCSHSRCGTPAELVGTAARAELGMQMSKLLTFFPCAGTLAALKPALTSAPPSPPSLQSRNGWKSPSYKDWAGSYKNLGQVPNIQKLSSTLNGDAVSHSRPRTLCLAWIVRL